MTAAKGKNAVEPLVDPLVQSLAHQNANVVNSLSICWSVKHQKKNSSFRVVNCLKWVKCARTRYPISSLWLVHINATVVWLLSFVNAYWCIISSFLPVQQHLFMHFDSQTALPPNIAWEWELDDTSFATINFPLSTHILALCLSLAQPHIRTTFWNTWDHWASISQSPHSPTTENGPLVLQVVSMMQERLRNGAIRWTVFL